MNLRVIPLGGLGEIGMKSDGGRVWRFLAGFGGSANINRGTIPIADNTITGNVTGVFELPDGKIMTMTSAGLMTNTIEGNGSNGTLTGSYTAK